MPQINLNALRVLGVLYREMPGEHYGLSLERTVKIRSGTLYPILEKLENSGLIQARWEDIDPRVAGRRPRRYYQITAQGIDLYQERRSEFLDEPTSGVRHATELA